MVQILETWRTQNLMHHLVGLELDSDFVGRFFPNSELAIVAGTNLTKHGLILQVVGKQTAIMEFLNAIRGRATDSIVAYAADVSGCAWGQSGSPGLTSVSACLPVMR